jgi:predicted DNA-binding helix-hairpin-helix protein
MRTAIATILLALGLTAAVQKIDINSALQVQLEKLPGITRVLAKKIVANRPYVALEDLKRLGIPAETIEKIRPLVVVDLSMPSNHPARRARKP